MFTLGLVLYFIVPLDIRLDCFIFFPVSWSRPVLLYISHLEPLSLYPRDLGLSYFHFHLSPCIFKFYLWLPHQSICCLVLCCLVSTCLWVFFPIFFLWFISSYILLCSAKIYGKISIFLNLLRLILWPNIWSILENIPCSLEKNVYSVVFGWNFLYIFVMSIWSNMSFKDSVFFVLIFFFHRFILCSTNMIHWPLPIGPRTLL